MGRVRVAKRFLPPSVEDMFGRSVMRREISPELASHVASRLRAICTPKSDPPRHRGRAPDAAEEQAWPSAAEDEVAADDGIAADGGMAPGDGVVVGGWIPTARRWPEDPQREETVERPWESAEQGPDETAGTGGDAGPEPGRTLTRGHVLLVVTALAVAVVVAVLLLVRSQPVAEPVKLSASQGMGGGGSSTPTTSQSPSTASGLPAVAPQGPAPTPTTLLVHVAGKVRKPGVVRLAVGSRVEDAIEAAGGALPKVEMDTLNLARPLVDGEQVLVGVTPPPGGPPPGPSAGSGEAGSTTTEDDDPVVHLNTATQEQLEELPGVGPVLAERILDYRAENGPFQSPEELLEVSGIGEATLDDLRDSVQVP